MLRIYFLQQWFDLSDPAVEDALYHSVAMRRFVGIDLGVEPAPDEMTVCRFRDLLERHGLGRKMLTTVNRYLERHGLKAGTGTIVDATLLHAPSSTRNKEGKHDPEMHQGAKALRSLKPNPSKMILELPVKFIGRIFQRRLRLLYFWRNRRCRRCVPRSSPQAIRSVPSSANRKCPAVERCSLFEAHTPYTLVF